MITLADLTVLFGWMSVVNIGFLLITTIVLTTMRGAIYPIHSKLLGVSDKDLSKMYVRYLANYKILVFVFSLAPYLALKLMGY